MKRLTYFVLLLVGYNLFASPLDDADNAFYTENWQRVIDIVIDEERSSAQQSFLSACRIRRCAASLALAAEGKAAVMLNENGERVSFQPDEVVSYFEKTYPDIEEKGSGRVDFWNYTAVAFLYAAQYYADASDETRVKEQLAIADNALRRSALMSAHNKQLWYFASLVYGNSSFAPDFHNLSFAVSFIRRYLMITGQEADILGLNRLSVLLRQRNFTLEEKKVALIEINKNLRSLSDPYKKYRYVEGYMPTTCWYNYASNHVFKNVSDVTEADLIDVYLKRKINPATAIGSYISARLNPVAAKAEKIQTDSTDGAEKNTEDNGIVIQNLSDDETQTTEVDPENAESPSDQD